MITKDFHLMKDFTSIRGKSLMIMVGVVGVSRSRSGISGMSGADPARHSGNFIKSPEGADGKAVERFDGVHAHFVDSPFEWHDGYLFPPSRPGLGFAVREAVAR